MITGCKTIWIKSILEGQRCGCALVCGCILFAKQAKNCNFYADFMNPHQGTATVPPLEESFQDTLVNVFKILVHCSLAGLTTTFNILTNL